MGLANLFSAKFLYIYNQDILLNADYLIDLGPEAGVYILAQGTPEEVALSKKSKTAPFLKKKIQVSNK
jgi:Excinuclease ATPase subunit